jgi:putative ATPase
MLVAGCDAKTIARRLLAIASEDIGNADPRALEIALNAWNVYERVGAKEGNRAIAQAERIHQIRWCIAQMLRHW